MKEYIDYKGKGCKVEFPHSVRAEETDSWKFERQISGDSIIMAGGFWRVVLPDDKHPEAMLLPNDVIQPPRYVHRTKCLEVESARKVIKDTNFWYKKRGGRKPKKENDGVQENEDE